MELSAFIAVVTIFSSARWDIQTCSHEFFCMRINYLIFHNSSSEFKCQNHSARHLWTLHNSMQFFPKNFSCSIFFFICPRQLHCNSRRTIDHFVHVRASEFLLKLHLMSFFSSWIRVNFEMFYAWQWHREEEKICPASAEFFFSCVEFSFEFIRIALGKKEKCSHSIFQFFLHNL